MDSDRTSHPAAVADDDAPAVIPLHPEYADAGEPPLERSAGQAVDRVAGEMGGRLSGVRGRFWHPSQC